jgi:hypothetical protein
MEMRDVSIPTPRAICASSTVARHSCPHARFFHHQPEAQADHQRGRDHEDAIERQIEPADDDAPGQRVGRIDVEIITGPDVQCRLLEQEGEPDREQDLAQRIESERPQEQPFHHQAEDRRRNTMRR